MKNEEVINNQQNENENTKKNYFNLIVGLTTLIIAILGASFAYFTVRGGSEENEIAVQAAYVKIGYEGGTKVKASDLIPASQSVMLWAYRDVTKQNTAFEGDPEDPEAPTTYQCLDKNNKKVCYVYRFTINAEGEENGTTKILGKIKVGTNSFVQTQDCIAATGTRSGLSYMVYKLEETSTDPAVTNPNYTKVSGGNIISQNSNDSALYEQGESNYTFTRFGLPSVSTEENPGGTVENFLFGDDGYLTIDNNTDNTYELVIWLHDDGCNQDVEQGQKFEGTIDISVDSGDNTGTDGRITGERD